jgi:membrane protein
MADRAEREHAGDGVDAGPRAGALVATKPGPHHGDQLPAADRSLWQILKDTVAKFRADNMGDWAAALTYYAVLSVFPALIVLVAIVGLVGQYPKTTDALLELVGQVGPPSAVETFRAPIEGVVQSKGGSGALLGFGLLAALWSASGYIGAFTRAANTAWEVPEGRKIYKLRPLQILITLVAVLLLALVLIALVVSGPIAQKLGDLIGLGPTAVDVWSIAKWPVLLVLVSAGIAGLYYITPNVRHPHFKFVTPGGALAVLAWVIASAGFAFYVSNFSSYNATYGALGAVVVFLLWLYITNAVILLGATLNAEIERGRSGTKGTGVPQQPPDDGETGSSGLGGAVRRDATSTDPPPGRSSAERRAGTADEGGGVRDDVEPPAGLTPRTTPRERESS